MPTFRGSILAIGHEFRGLLEMVRQECAEHGLFWISFIVGVAVFWWVDQIFNIWWQYPPMGAGWLLSILWGLLFLFLLGFYSASVFAVIPRSVPPWIPAQWAHLRAFGGLLERPTAWLRNRWDNLLTSWQGARWFNPLFYLGHLGRGATLVLGLALSLVRWGVWILYFFLWLSWTILVIGIDRSSHFFVWAVSHRPGANGMRPFRRGLLVWSLILLLLAIWILWRGAQPDSHIQFALTGTACRTIGALVLAIALWLGFQAVLHGTGRSDHLSPLGIYQGRFLSWLLLTTAGGEILWWVAGTESAGYYVSYRVYTIWAAFQLLTLLILTAQLIDRWHTTALIWPARLLFLIVLLYYGLGFWSGAAELSPTDFEHHLAADAPTTWKAASLHDEQGEEQRNEHWFELLEKRIAGIPENQGPAVIVAASGGGSRAAIFTALSLETLGRTPLDPDSALLNEADRPPGTRTWSDNIVLISSVSGGSLATGYHVRRGQQLTEVADLHNTTKTELIHRLGRQAERLIERYRRNHANLPEAGTPAYVQSLDQELRYRDQQWVRLQQERAALQKLCGLLSPASGGAAGFRLRLKQIDDLQIDKLLELLWSERYWHQLASEGGDEDALFAPSENPLKQKLRQRREMLRSRWVLRGEAFDAMCTDFMAPIMRGALSPFLDRGDALASFWTQRFGWENCTDLNGYGGNILGWSYQPDRPLVIFNACDVTHGSRVAIGFPPLPVDFWQRVDRQVDPLGRPKTLGEVYPGHRISLARAIRMSSNFPWGFRIMQLGSNLSPQEPIHVLDGGVTDNTGLDTVYEVFRALEFYAQRENAPALSDYLQRAGEILRRGIRRERARAILRQLRQRGVVLVEIDSGTKPTTAIRKGRLAGLLEPIDGLTNAGYATAEQVKKLYIREIQRILTRDLDELTNGDPARETSLAEFREKLPLVSTVFHVQLQCNHHEPDEAAAPTEVMTAWTLGPEDKAEIVARFLVELGFWDKQKRRDVYLGLDKGRRGFAVLAQQAQLRVRRDLAAQRLGHARQAVAQLAQKVDDLLGPGVPRQALRPALLTELRGKFDEQERENAQLRQELAQLPETFELKESLDALTARLGELQQRLRPLVQSTTFPPAANWAYMEEALHDLAMPTFPTQAQMVEPKPTVRPRLPLDLERDNSQTRQQRLDAEAARDRRFLQKRP
jgi:hypothetical protein